MRILAGTSGFSYPAWRGTFYPPELKEAEMLAFYARRFATVEINNTFYRMPNPAILARWAGQTPSGFAFVLKAPRRLTHEKRLADGEGLAHFLRTAAGLGGKLGPLLFQLPPFFKKDLTRLSGFLARLPPEARVALEFRHQSWFDEEVFSALRASRAALCLADTDEGGMPALVSTSDWGYLRLRRAGYDESALVGWAGRIRAQPWTEAYVFFKHEESGPALAERLLKLASS